MSAAGAEHDTAGQGSMENVSFVNVDFLRQFGLNEQNVLQYFYTSFFYARCGGSSSLNEQRRKGEKPVAGKGGHEFVLAFSNEEAKLGNVEMSIFVLQKLIYQDGKDGGVPYDTFYIVSGTIFKAPNIGHVFDSALRSALHAFHSIFSRQTEDLKSKRRRICVDTAQLSIKSPVSGMQADRKGTARMWPACAVFDYGNNQHPLAARILNECRAASSSAISTNAESAKAGSALPAAAAAAGSGRAVTEPNTRTSQ